MSKEAVEGESMSSPATVEDEGGIEKLNEDGDQPEAGVSRTRMVHQFYFVKSWPYKNPSGHSKMEWARKLCEELDQEKKRVVDDKMEEIMSRGNYINSQLQRKRYRSAVLECGVEWKTMVVNFLRGALEKLNDSTSISSKQYGKDIHSPRVWVTHGSHNLANEEQLSTKIPSGQLENMKSSYLRSEINRAYFWYSQSNNREKFQQILEEVKQIEDRLEKAMADAAAKGNIWNPLSSKKAIEEQIKILNKIPEELRPECDEVMAEIKSLENELKAVKKDENIVSEKFQDLINRKKEAYECILCMRNEEDEANANYNEYISLISNAKELCRKKDVAALQELSRTQVDEFMSRWNSNQSFRTTYEKAILPSLDYRQLSRDGRTRNDDEEPISKHGDIYKLSLLRLVSNFLALMIVFEAHNIMQGSSGH